MAEIAPFRGIRYAASRGRELGQLIAPPYDLVSQEQRDELAARNLPSLVLPDHAVDAQSLIALSDLVVSAGGTMNREAAALGVPVYTTFGGKLGAVDEAPLREGRLRRLADPAELDLAKRSPSGSDRVRRDPALFLDLLLPV